MATEVKTICAVCDGELRCRWTDTHGVGACLCCGAPYRLYYYEGEGDQRRRVERPPQLLLQEIWISLHRRYWAEEHSNVDPGGYNFPGSSYEVASRETFERHRDWFNARKDEWPPEETSSA